MKEYKITIYEFKVDDYCLVPTNKLTENYLEQQDQKNVEMVAVSDLEKMMESMKKEVH